MASALRYVVLRHEGIAQPHFDLMFETAPDSPLATWRADRWPIHHGSALTKLPDHRRAYLEYEGPLSGDRGQVSRVTAGTFLLANNNTGLFAGEFSDTGVQFTFVKDGPDSWVCYFAS
jgi:hypothetical protein